jgi:hypothetical protein
MPSSRIVACDQDITRINSTCPRPAADIGETAGRYPGLIDGPGMNHSCHLLRILRPGRGDGDAQHGARTGESRHVGLSEVVRFCADFRRDDPLNRATGVSTSRDFCAIGRRGPAAKRGKSDFGQGAPSQWGGEQCVPTYRHPNTLPLPSTADVRGRREANRTAVVRAVSTARKGLTRRQAVGNGPSLAQDRAIVKQS